MWLGGLLGSSFNLYFCTDTIECMIAAVLAAWMRLKYPHIAVGALASSAPILQFEDVVPSTIFYDLVSNDFKVFILQHFLFPYYSQYT